MKWVLTLCLVLVCTVGFNQTFYFGNDLSYVNEMEDCGAVFKENDVAKDVYQIFADHGTNLVRVRLWHNPSWQNALVQPEGVKLQYSDYEDVKETISRVKKAGMMVMLDIQLTDFWADPGKQLIPAAWLSVASDTALLADSVYNYVSTVLADLSADTLMPEIVKIGNENNGGILRHTTLNADYTVSGSISTNWTRHAHFYKAAIKAVRDAGTSFGITPKISLHCAGLNNTLWWYQNIINYGVTDFDIMGFSYYYAWHSGSITAMGDLIRSLKSAHPSYDVMVAETGYLWSTKNYDALGNIITTPDPAYLPVCPDKQREYMVDFSREIMNAGGVGLVFWEPAWVSTPCRTPWGVGSSQEHVAFFDPANTNFMEKGAGTWPESEFYQHLNYKKVTFKVSATNPVVPGKMYITGDMTGEPWKILPMLSEGSNVYSWYTYLPEGDTGAFFFLNDSSWDARESVPASCANMWNTDRRYIVGANDVVISYVWGTCLPIGAVEPVNVTFKVDMTGQDVTNGVWVTGDMTGSPWKIMQMTLESDNVYYRTFVMYPGNSGAFYFMDDNVWGSRESVPRACADWWDTDRGYNIGNGDTTYAFTWGTCEPVGYVNGVNEKTDNSGILIFPNPVSTQSVSITIDDAQGPVEVKITDLSGRTITEHAFENALSMSLNPLIKPGTYMVYIKNRGNTYYKRLIVR